MKGQMLPLICLHNSLWSPGWLIPTEGLSACHLVMRVFYSRWSESNKEPNQGPRSPQHKAAYVCASNRHSRPITYTASPWSCNHFYVGGPGPVQDPLMPSTRHRVCYSNRPPPCRGQGACQHGGICTCKTCCRGRVETVGGENQTNLWWKRKAGMIKGPNVHLSMPNASYSSPGRKKDDNGAGPCTFKDWQYSLHKGLASVCWLYIELHPLQTPTWAPAWKSTAHQTLALAFSLWEQQYAASSGHHHVSIHWSWQCINQAPTSSFILKMLLSKVGGHWPVNATRLISSHL